MTLPPPDHAKSNPSRPAACFTVLAGAGPGILPRVLEPFAKRSLVPARLHTSLDSKEMAIDLQVEAVAPALAAQIANELRNIWGVKTVLIAERRGPSGLTVAAA